MLGDVRDSWCQDLRELTTKLQGMSPLGWELYGSTLLDNADVLQQLFRNSDYVNIGPVVEVTRGVRKACTALVRDGCGAFVPNEILLAARQAQIHGSLTVTTTYVAYTLKMVTPSLLDANTPDSLQKLLLSLKPKGHTFADLCESLQKEIKRIFPDAQSI